MRYLVISATALMLASPAAYAVDHTAATSSPAQQFVDQVANINLMEIDAAQAAEQKAANSAYKDYAKMIITDHTKMQNDLKNVATKMPDVAVPSGLDKEHEQKLQQLKSASGATFEREYRQDQIEGHQKAIKLFQDFAKNDSNAKDADLKSLAQSSVPTLQKHLQHAQNLPQQGTPAAANQSNSAATTGAAPANNASSGAQKLVNDAAGIVKQMKSDKTAAELLQKAKGLYIVPEFGRGAVIVGGRGGVGLLTVRENGKWSSPAFYDFGAVSLGAQVGGSGGAMVFALMNDKAVNVFKRTNSFSLNAGAGLSIVNYSANKQASWGKSDIVTWSDTSGAYIGATVSVTDISWDSENNHSFYGNDADVNKILSGGVTNAKADELTTALPD